MLNGKVAVIIGGTRGIGLEIARKYLQNNATIIVLELVKKVRIKLMLYFVKNSPMLPGVLWHHSLAIIVAFRKPLIRLRKDTAL